MIHARGLTRDFTYKGEIVQAVRGLDLDVGEGELVAFLGPNGAGKTTSLRMLTTLLPPTSGTATVAGHNVATAAPEVRRRIGYIGQGHGSGNDYRVIDELIAHGRYYGLSRAEARTRAYELLGSLGIAPMAKRVAERLSGGQRRRLDIAMGLIHQPVLLFLDEPSSGLDPQNRANLWEHIRDLHRQRAATIFLTTHYLDEADQLAERVIIFDHGRVVADDTPERLKADLAGDLITIVAGSEGDAKSAAAKATRVTSPDRITLDGTKVAVRVSHGDEVLPQFLRVLDNDQVKVSSVTLDQPSLDDVFLAITGRTLRDADENEA